MQGMQGIGHLRAPARKEQMQGMQGIWHLRAPAPKEPVQGMQGIGHLRAPARQEQMQGMQGIEHLRAPKHKKQMKRNQRNQCRECKGSGICEHQRVRSRCRDCKGSSICKHQRQKSRCQECKGSGMKKEAEQPTVAATLVHSHPPPVTFPSSATAGDRATNRTVGSADNKAEDESVQSNVSPDAIVPMEEEDGPEAKVTEASSVQSDGTEDNESDKTGVKDGLAAQPEAAEAILEQEVASSEKYNAPATANAAEPSAEHVQKPEGVYDRIAAEPEAAGEAKSDQEVTPDEKCDVRLDEDASAGNADKKEEDDVPSRSPPVGKRPMEAVTEAASEPALKRPRVYARRHKRRAPMLTELDEVFRVVREPDPACSLVVSQAEYLAQLWEIFRSDFHSEFTFALFKERVETKRA